MHVFLPCAAAADLHNAQYGTRTRHIFRIVIFCDGEVIAQMPHRTLRTKVSCANCSLLCPSDMGWMMGESAMGRGDPKFPWQVSKNRPLSPYGRPLE